MPWNPSNCDLGSSTRRRTGPAALFWPLDPAGCAHQGMNTLDQTLDATSTNSRPLFAAALIVGLGLAAYLYLVAFDDLSEDLLMGLSPLWVVLIAFGATGWIAENGRERVLKGDAVGLLDGMWQTASASRVLLLLFVELPCVVYAPTRAARTPLGVAALTALFWTVALYAFFLLLWPQL